MQRNNRGNDTNRFQDCYRYWKRVEGQGDVGTGRAVRMHRRFLRRTRWFLLRVEGNLVRVVFRRMMAEMLGGATGFMLAIRSDHAPAELKSEDRQDEVDEASGSHEEKYSTPHRLPSALKTALVGAQHTMRY